MGVINFTSINFDKKQSYLGLYANLFEKITGIGRALEETCLKYNFKEVGMKNINDKKVICMELVK